MKDTEILKLLDKLEYRHDIMCREVVSRCKRDRHNTEGVTTTKIFTHHRKQGAI